MRNATIVGTVTFFLALCAIPGLAQDDDDRRGSIPRGDYVQSCRNIHIRGDRLVAECQERDGDWRRTSLDDFNRCSGEIVNNNGNLVCAQGQAGYGYGDRREGRRDWQNGLPPGDYVQTCRNIHMEGDRLEAQCQERDGDWRRTSLDDVDRCSGAIVNNNGNLVCAQGQAGYGYDNGRRNGWQGGIPSGTYTETCRNIHVDGDRLLAECQERDGDWRQTSLDDFQRCTSAPANDNGRLVCGRN